MSRYASLIRLHRWKVDERRRILADLEELGIEMRGRLERLEADIEHEQEIARKTAEAARHYPAFAAAMTQRRDTLKRSIENVNQQIAHAREVLAEAYRELKKYEIAEDGRRRQLRHDADRREQSALDEIAIGMYRRRRD